MIIKPNLFEVILFEFLYFSIRKDNMNYTVQFPLGSYSECDYDCTHFSGFDDDMLINYISKELFE